MNTDIQLLVDRLVQRMDLDRIFLFSYPFLEKEKQQLLLVVNPVKGLSPKAMAPIVSLCMSDTTEIPFDMVLTGEWQNQLKQGSLYYTYASLPPHQLHAASTKKNPLFSRKTVTGLLELSQLNYKKSRKQSDEFREAADNFLAKDDYSQATFMLHQFMELRLKGFQAALGMNGGKSHSVQQLMKSVRNVAPQLLEIFPCDGPSAELFRMPDQAYTQAKKQETIAISLDEFNLLLEQCERARTVMDGMVAAMVERITAYRGQLEAAAAQQAADGARQAPNAATLSPMASTQLICEDFSGFPWPEQYKKDVNALLDRIHQTHRPEQVMMLNYHTGGFSGVSPFQQEQVEEREGSKTELYLVVLMKNKGPFHFRCMEVGEASAMVVYLNVKTVQKNLAEGNRFFHTMWTKGRTLRRKATFEPSFEVASVDWKAEYDRAEQTWRNAKACMGNLNELIQNAGSLKLDTCMLLLGNLLEIGVNTYLRCAVGFVPFDVHLAELIDWSGVAGRQLLDVLYPTSEIEKTRMRLMLSPHAVWWQNMEIGLSGQSQAFYRTRAKEMVHFFETLCEGAVKELEGKAGTAIKEGAEA
jgi:HEPN domain.